jgi:dTDP-4-amino-4,6-dideoxygalactose transaminase
MKNIDDRNTFIAYMRDAGIITPFHYVPLHSAPAGLEYGHVDGPLDVTDNISKRLVRLPMFFDLGSEAETVIDHAHSYFSKEKGGL